MNTLASGNFERIWLEPREGADPYIGRQWCQDNQWGEDGVEYVRADIASLSAPPAPARDEEIERLEGKLAEAFDAGFRQSSEGYNYEYYPEALTEPEFSAERSSFVEKAAEPDNWETRALAAEAQLAALQSERAGSGDAVPNSLAGIVANLNPEEATDDRILRDIHLRLQTWGEKDAERMVSVLHRNLVLWAACKSIDAAIAGKLEAER